MRPGRQATRWATGVAAVLIGLAAPAQAQGTLGLEKQILPVTHASWASFWEYEGKQWVYFTHLVAQRCGLSELRYSFNSDALDQTFPLPPCDKQNPNHIDAEKHPPLVTLPPGTAKSVAIQVVYTDGEETAVVRLAPCDDATTTACAVLLED